MVKLYFFWNNGAAPSGYTKETGWNGRYVMFGGSYGDHGVLGGNLTHTNNAQNVSISNSDYVGEPGSAGGAGFMTVHNHAPGSWTGLSENNDPSYYTLELLSIDLSTWETYHRQFPVGAIFLSEAALDFAELGRLSSPDNYLIKLGAPGSTGGRLTSQHTIGNTFANNSQGVYLNDAGGMYDLSFLQNHSHTVQITTGAISTLPARIQTRLYRQNSQPGLARAGITCFVDNTPSAYWDLVNWANRFPQSVNSDATPIGSNTHDHLNLAGESSTNYAGQAPLPYGAGSNSIVPNYHHHHVTLNLASADHRPQYVTLIPVKLNTTLYHIYPRSSMIMV